MSRVDEILAVKALGSKIGYGNIMDIASALWSMDLTDIDGEERIAHISTVLPCLKSKDKEQAKDGVRTRILEIKHELGFKS